MVGYFSRWTIITNTICVVLVIPAVALRYMARKRTRMTLGADDLMITISMALSIGVAIMNIVAGTTNCLDKTLPDIAGMEKAHMIAYLEIIIALPAYGTSKAAIVLFCKRIFVGRDFAIAANILLGAIFCWTVSGLLVHIWSAHPISSWWTQIIPAFVLNWNVYFIYLVAINMVLDIMIWMLPVVVIGRLNMSASRKVFLSSIFGLGLLCILISAVRLYFAVQLYRAVNFKIAFKYYWTSLAWSIIFTTIEATLALVIVCLPTYGPLFRGFPKMSTPSTGKTFQSNSTTTQNSSIRIEDMRSPSDQAKVDWPLPPSPDFRRQHFSLTANPAGWSGHQSKKSATTCVAEVTNNVSQQPQPDSILVETAFGYHFEEAGDTGDRWI